MIDTEENDQNTHVRSPDRAAVGQGEGETSFNNPYHHHHHHPLMNPLTLESVFNYCDPETLAQARLVNNEWYKDSLKVWKRGSPIVLSVTEHRNRDELCFWEPIGTPQSMKEFLRSSVMGSTSSCFESSEESKKIRGILQYQHFEIQAPQYDDGLLLTSFWNQWGVSITKLQIRDFLFPTLKSLEEVLMSRHTPNLELLDIHITPGEQLLDRNRSGIATIAEEDIQGEHKKLKCLKIGVRHRGSHLKLLDASKQWRFYFPFEWWRTLLNYYHKLERFTLYPDHHFVNEMSSVLTAIKDIRRVEPTKLLALKSLNWFANDETEKLGDNPHFRTEQLEQKSCQPLLQLLNETDLQLEGLGADVPYYHHSKERIHETLAKQGSSLQRLSCGSGWIPWDSLLSEAMAVLQVLSVWNPPSLLFLKWLPPSVHTLKIFDQDEHYLSDSIFADAKKNKMVDVIAPSVTTFFWKNSKSNVTPSDIGKIGLWMPNICRLEMRLTDAVFGSVVSHFPALAHLRVFGEELGDVGLVGLRTERRGHVVSYEQPNISNLQNLRSFVIDNPLKMPPSTRRRSRAATVTGGASISKHSVLHGFLKLPLLDTLVLKTAWLVTAEARALLEDKLPFAEVKMIQPPSNNPRKSYVDDDTITIGKMIREQKQKKGLAKCTTSSRRGQANK